MINYAEKIKEYREKKFLTQSELAKELGVTLLTVSRWETGKFEPNMKMKKKLFNLFIKNNIEVGE